MHVELVRVDGTLHHRFTQPVAGRDEHHVVEAGFGVDREHHAGRAQIGSHHTLHTGRQSDHIVLEAFVHAVADGAIVVERRKHFLHLVQHVVDADHVQEGFLLACKGCVGQVFGGGRRADGKRCRRVVGAEGDKGLTDGLLQVGRERLRLDHRANLGAGHCQRPHVFGVQRGQPLADPVGQAVMRQELPEGVRGGREPCRDAHALRQLGNHLAEAGILAANRLDVGHPQVLKWYDQGGRFEQC